MEDSDGRLIINRLAKIDRSALHTSWLLSLLLRLRGDSVQRLVEAKYVCVVLVPLPLLA